LLHAYSLQLQLSASQVQKNSYGFFLTSCHNSIFAFKLRTLRLKILKKLRTASLNSEFSGFYKKKVYNVFTFITTAVN